jgi:hypothetical protein
MLLLMLLMLLMMLLLMLLLMMMMMLRVFMYSLFKRKKRHWQCLAWQAKKSTSMARIKVQTGGQKQSRAGAGAVVVVLHATTNE